MKDNRILGFHISNHNTTLLQKINKIEEKLEKIDELEKLIKELKEKNNLTIY